MKKAVFAGSFNPFTIGHASIVERALPIFDSITIGVGVNSSKVTPEYESSMQQRVEAIRILYAGNEKVKVESYTGLTAHFAKQQGAQYIIKGVRSVKDFEYEREQADINRMISGIETVIFFSLPELSSVSSSLVRELQQNGCPTEKFIPKTRQ